MNIIMGTALIAGFSYLGIRIMMSIDPEHGIYFGKKGSVFLLFASMVSALVWSITIKESSLFISCVWMMIHIYFVMSSVMDVLTHQIYDIFQYPALIAAAILSLLSDGSPMVGISVILFCLIQYFVFMHFYGKADGMAFMVAALTEGSLGYDLTMYFLHMIFAYLLLCMIQLLKRNVANCIRLKTPVAFYPYIMISLWCVILWG